MRLVPTPAVWLALALAQPVADGRAFVVDTAGSSVRVHVGKSGLLAVAGHRHVVAAPVRGTILVDAQDPTRSSVDLVFPTAEFRVLPDEEPQGDAPKVEEVMHGPRVLDVGRFPEVRFRSASVETRPPSAAGRPGFDVQVTGDLGIHGVERRLTVPLLVTLDGDTLTAKGRTTISHDQFGLTPVTVAGGTVRVKNEIEIEFDVVARRR